MKQEVSPGIIAAAIIIVVLFLGFLGWKTFAKGASSGGGGSPYKAYKGTIPGQAGAGSGGMSHGPGRGGPGSGGAMGPGGSGGAPGMSSAGGSGAPGSGQ